MPLEQTSSVHKPTASGVSSQGQLQTLIDVISRSQQGYRDLIDRLDQAMFTLSVRGEIRVANVRFCEILGSSFHDVIGHNIAEFLQDPTPVAISAALPDLIKAGSWSGRIPIRLVGASGFRYYDCWLQAIEEGGAPIAVSGWARDVTTQKEAEIRSVELFESLQEGIVSSMPTGEIVEPNPALLRMLGYSDKRELQHQNLRQLHADPQQHRDFLHELLSKGFVRDKEIALLRKDGSLLYCLTSGFVVRDLSGSVVRLQIIVTDLTEQRETARQLHQEREFGRRLIACFPDIIAVLDTDGRFTYISESVRDLLGRTPASFLRQPITSLCASEDRGSLSRMLQGLLSRSSIHGQIECHMAHQDGSTRTVRLTAAPLLNESGQLSGVVTSARDVTESNLLDQEHAKKEKFTAMGQMLAGAAHELNNPLTAILGVSDLMRESSSDETTRRQAELIVKQARRAAVIVQNLLAFSRPVSEAHQPLRIEEVVQRTLQSLEPSLRQKGIVTEFKCAPGLPLVPGDRKLLSQVFSNLVINAEQAISVSRESGRLVVSITAGTPPNDVCIAFENDGPPILPENMSKLFDPFFTTKRPGGGSGLGLTICMAVVKDHLGSIEVDSVANGPVTFRVLLPAQQDSNPTPEILVRQSKASDSLRALEGRTVLIVDDEESIREILEEGLSSRGMRVKCASDGEESLAWLDEKTCDIVICDFNMPRMKGAELFERMRARSGGKPPIFILMTGELVESAEIAALRQAGALTLQKPFHISGVADLISKALG